MFEEAKKYLVGGMASALHKAPWQEYPIFITRGKGSRLYDLDGNEYIDYMGGFGPMILGYAPEVLNEAVKKQLELGTHFAAPSDTLIELSKKLVENIPCAEKVCYQCTGSEANMFAMRLARAYTGKQKILKFEGHYHGWSDEEKVSNAAGSLQELGPRSNPWKVLQSFGQRPADDIIVAPWNDLDYLEELFKRRGHEIAGVITEQIMLNAEPVYPKPGFLEGLRELTTKYGIVLIFDEVITGFRLSLGGAQKYFGVTPDLATFAKSMAGGYPIAAIAGKEEILMAGDAPVGTFNGNPLSVAAALATIGELEKGAYEKMSALTDKLVSGVNDLIKKYGIKAYCRGTVAVWTIQFGITEPIDDFRDHFAKIDKQTYQDFYKAALDAGFLLHPNRGRFYMTTAHTDEDIQKTLEFFEDFFKGISG